MRLFLSTLLAALIVPLAANAQAPKQVEVINLPVVQEVTGTVEVVNPDPIPVSIPEPLQVEVINHPPATIVLTVPARIGFVGFAPPHDGDFSDVTPGYEHLGGNNRPDLYCAQHIPGTHLCLASESRVFADAAALHVAWENWPEEGAWEIDGLSGSNKCFSVDRGGWWLTNDSSTAGRALYRDTTFNVDRLIANKDLNGASCDVARPVACCGWIQEIAPVLP